MNCRNCDTDVGENALFCSQCGQAQVLETNTSKIADRPSDLYSGNQPRSYAGTVLQLLFITGLPFGLLFGGAMSMMFGWPYGELLPLWIITGLTFGLFFGLAMAPKFKGKTVEVEFEDKSKFVNRANISLAEAGYSPTIQSGTLLQFKPTFRAGLAAGQISIALRENAATIVGPVVYVNKIAKSIGR